jgi:phosphoribosylanthranilate isomerase
VTQVKICGLRTQAEVSAAAAAGANYVGFNFFAPSPRALTLAEARPLAEGAPRGLRRVALTVDEGDAFFAALIEVVPLDMLQLHGRESPERVAEVRDRFGLPVMKVIGLADESDLPALADHAAVADQILVDARPPAGAALPGGNGVPFDWRLLTGRRWPVPWMLAGGLTPENVVEAVRLTGAAQVDVSSGVEAAPGRKDLDRIAAFIRAARGEAEVEKEAAR